MEGCSPGKVDTPHVFISYRRQDKTVVDELVSALGASYLTWRDTAEIRGGQLWREAIARGIDQGYALILVVSAATEHSKGVYAEYFYALGRGLPVIPLLVEDCKELPWGLEIRNARTWHRQREQTLCQLKADLDSYRGESRPVVAANPVYTYLNSLQLAYLRNVGNYTPMLGEVRQRRRGVSAKEPLRPVEMQSRLLLRRSSPLLNGEEVREEVRDHQALLPALHELQRVVLLGEPGIGKTTTLYKFADELRSRCLTDIDAPLPVILPLLEWKGESDVESFIKEHLGGLAGQYRRLIEAHRLYLLCDGLNEIARDAQRADKVDALRTQIGAQVPLVATCRELDYRDEVLRLDMDTITVRPLEPSRIQDFLTRYLVDIHGEEAGPAAAQNLFWQIAGGDGVRAVWKKWCNAGASLEQFFQSDEIPRESPDVYSAMNWNDVKVWYERVNSAANLIHLAANPYLLWMFLNVYRALGHIPGNRGGLFDEFVFQLLKREGLTRDESPNEVGKRLSGQLEDLAWKLQSQAAVSGEPARGAQLTLPRPDAVVLLGDEHSLHRAASANLLEDAESVRFAHQLLQEYFAAQRLLAEIKKGLKAKELWSTKRWWVSSGWEEVVILAVGMSDKPADIILDWILPANPEVAAFCIQGSGVDFDDELKLRLRKMWLHSLTDVGRYPQAAARAAIGRALGSVSLKNGEPLDNRPGVGLTVEGMPDIAWVEIPGGQVGFEKILGPSTPWCVFMGPDHRFLDLDERWVYRQYFQVKPFQIARFPVTNLQFQAFVDAKDGYRNDDWWEDLEQSDSPSPPYWSETNHPRETVSWYEAVAFCRWLTQKYREQGILDEEKEIRLPTEWEWQQTATVGNPKNVYPWGHKSDNRRANTEESRLNRTTAVGMYPQGQIAQGVSEISGNVCEWCLNKYKHPHDTSLGGEDGRVLRGGSWMGGRGIATSSFREEFRFPYIRDANLGFRVCCASPNQMVRNTISWEKLPKQSLITRLLHKLGR